MIGPWQRRWRAWREARILRQRAIPDPLWQLTLACFPFLGQRPAEDVAELRRLATLFLAEKEFSGMHGLQVTDEMAVFVAAQAALPVLKLGLARYGGFVGIVIHPDLAVARRETQGEDGVVHQFEETLAGEAMEGGPVMLSWQDVAQAGETAEWGYNVVIHEFAHVLDMGRTSPEAPPLWPDRATHAAWVTALHAAYQALCQDVTDGRPTFLDDYGAHSVEEFFAVASETFFVQPAGLCQACPGVYTLLRQYYRQDPAAWAPQDLGRPIPDSVRSV